MAAVYEVFLMLRNAKTAKSLRLQSGCVKEILCNFVICMYAPAMCKPGLRQPFGEKQKRPCTDGLKINIFFMRWLTVRKGRWTACRLGRLFALVAAVMVFNMLLPTDVFTLYAEEGAYTELYNAKQEASLHTVSEGEAVGIQFSSVSDISGIGIYAKRVGTAKKSVSAALYRWNTDYDTSIAGTALFTEELDSGKIKSDKYIDFMFDGTAEAGEYLAVFSVNGADITLELSTGFYKARTFLKSCISKSACRAIIYGAAPEIKTVTFISPKLPDIPEESLISADSAISLMNVDSDSWTLVDGLGRTLPSYSDVGNKKERYVGMFYWTWHDAHSSNKARNITQIINENPDAVNDWSHDAWKGTYANFWDEPLYGYYRTSDSYVLRKHAELLADAGVDVVIFDCTNGTFTWDSGYTALCETFRQAREDGVRTPQIAFMLTFGANSDSKEMLINLYNNLYSVEKYQELWFYWDGKPLIMAYDDNLSESDEVEYRIKNFFTFRKNDPSYFSSDNTERWGWLSNYPQALYGEIGADGRPEQITVGVSQNANDLGLTAMNGRNVHGRAYSSDKDGNYSYSYTYKGETVTVTSDTKDAYLYGVNFQQQWDNAIAKDPDFVFVTGWNEWTMGRYRAWPLSNEAGSKIDLDTVWPSNQNEYLIVENAFPDQYNYAYSRDIEPSAGVLKDNYYCQLVANIRRYKGMDNIVPKMPNKTIDMSDLSSWDAVESSYNHYLNNTYERDARGYGGVKYENNTMRNDIVNAKVAYDDSSIYFYVKTAEALSPSSDAAWMRLFVDTDFEGLSDNWEGFEYIINRTSPGGGSCTVERSRGVSEAGEWQWENVGSGNIVINGDVLQISVEREVLGLTGKDFAFNFKWSDNMQEDGNALDFYVNGDAAPGGRFAFSAVTYDIKDVDGKSFPTRIVLITVILIAAAGIIIIVVSVLRGKNKKVRGVSEVPSAETAVGGVKEEAAGADAAVNSVEIDKADANAASEENKEKESR